MPAHLFVIGETIRSHLWCDEETNSDQIFMSMLMLMSDDDGDGVVACPVGQ